MRTAAAAAISITALVLAGAACGGNSSPASMSREQEAQLQFQMRSLFEEAQNVTPSARAGCGVASIGSANFQGSLTYVAWTDCLSWPGATCSVDSAAAHTVKAVAATYRNGSLFSARSARPAYFASDVPAIFPPEFRTTVARSPSPAQRQDMEAQARAQAGCT